LYPPWVFPYVDINSFSFPYLPLENSASADDHHWPLTNFISK
jgi:hypothetical protein